MSHGSIWNGCVRLLRDLLSRGVMQQVCDVLRVCAHALNKRLSHCLRAAGHTATEQTSCGYFVGTG